MKKWGLTGGIGTGKTFISKTFLKKGIPVFYADDEAKKLYADAEVLQQLREVFGEKVFENGKPNFRKLADLVFNNHDALEKLEAILHPRVMGMFEQWATQQHSEIVIMESAILYEAHLEHYFDKVMVVNASVGKRIERIKRRNPELTEAEISWRGSTGRCRRKRSAPSPMRSSSTRKTGELKIEN